MKKKIEELNKLKHLLEEGLIEPDEFEILKAEILGQDNPIPELPIAQEIKEEIIKPNPDSIVPVAAELIVEEEVESKVLETSAPPSVKETIIVEDSSEEAKKPKPVSSTTKQEDQKRKKKSIWIALLFVVLGVSIIVIGVMVSMEWIRMDEPGGLANIPRERSVSNDAVQVAPEESALTAFLLRNNPRT